MKRSPHRPEHAQNCPPKRTDRRARRTRVLADSPTSQSQVTLMWKLFEGKFNLPDTPLGLLSSRRANRAHRVEIIILNKARPRTTGARVEISILNKARPHMTCARVKIVFLNKARPTPATHSILILSLKAGERVYHIRHSCWQKSDSGTCSTTIHF